MRDSFGDFAIEEMAKKNYRIRELETKLAQHTKIVEAARAQQLFHSPACDCSLCLAVR